MARQDNEKWERPEYTERQAKAIANGNLEPAKLNAQLRAAGKGVRR